MSKVEFKLTDLPPMPQVVTKIYQIDENHINISSDQMQAIIAADPGLTGKILKIANSAFYSRSSRVSSLSGAITLLGFKTIKSLTLLVSVSGIFSQSKATKEIQKYIWMRSVLAALATRYLAQKLNKKDITEEVFMATLLRNIGQGIMLNKDQDVYNDIFRQSQMGIDFITLRSKEKKSYGITSAQLSGMAMKKWNFPQALVNTAKLEDYNCQTAKDIVGEISLFTLLGEVIVTLCNLTDQAELNEKQLREYTILFEKFSTELKLSNELKNYFLNDFHDAVKKDEFYNFCEELFLM